MFINSLDAITNKSIKLINFIFRAITNFIFGVIIGFVFVVIANFVIRAIHLLCNCGRKYLRQIKVRLIETIVYLDKIYLYYIYFCQYFCYKY